MSSVRRLPTLSPGRVGTTTRTGRSATSAHGKPRSSERTRCSSSGPTTPVGASDPDLAALNARTAASDAMEDCFDFRTGAPTAASVADFVEASPPIRDFLERRGSDRDWLSSHVSAAEAFVETAGCHVVAQDPHDHVRQLHLAKRARRGAHQLTAVPLTLCAIEHVDRIELA